MPVAATITISICHPTQTTQLAAHVCYLYIRPALRASSCTQGMTRHYFLRKSHTDGDFWLRNNSLFSDIVKAPSWDRVLPNGGESAGDRPLPLPGQPPHTRQQKPRRANTSPPNLLRGSSASARAFPGPRQEKTKAEYAKLEKSSRATQSLEKGRLRAL